MNTANEYSQSNSCAHLLTSTSLCHHHLQSQERERVKEREATGLNRMFSKQVNLVTVYLSHKFTGNLDY